MEQRVDKGSGLDAGARVYDHAGGLVDGDDRGVLVEDTQRDSLGRSLKRWKLRGLKIDGVASAQALRSASRRMVDEGAAGLDPVLYTGSAKLRQLLVEELIEAAAGARGIDGELHLRPPGRRRWEAGSAW